MTDGDSENSIFSGIIETIWYLYKEEYQVQWTI